MSQLMPQTLSNDIKIFRNHFICRQLKEAQRKRNIQQVDQGKFQPSSFEQPAGPVNQSDIGRLISRLDYLSIDDESGSTIKNEYIGLKFVNVSGSYDTAQQSNYYPMNMNAFVNALANSNNEGQSGRIIDPNPLLFNQRNNVAFQADYSDRNKMIMQPVGFASFHRDENAFAKKAHLEGNSSRDEKISVKDDCSNEVPSFQNECLIVRKMDLSSENCSAVTDETEKQFRKFPLSNKNSAKYNSSPTCVRNFSTYHQNSDFLGQFSRYSERQIMTDDLRTKRHYGDGFTNWWNPDDQKNSEGSLQSDIVTSAITSQVTTCTKEEDNQGNCIFMVSHISQEENQPLDSLSNNLRIFSDTSTSTNISFEDYRSQEIQTEKRSAKKSKKLKFSSNASKVAWMVPIVDGSPIDSELFASSCPSSLSSLKMINFASSENISSKKLHASTKQEQLPWITAHTFIPHSENHRNCEDVKVEEIYNEEPEAKSSHWQQMFPNLSNSMEKSNILNKRKSVGVEQGSSCFTYKAATESSSIGLQFDDVGHDLVLRTKKPKVARSELIPWHKRVTEGYGSLQTLSMSEIDWARAANRKIDKVEADIEMKDGIQMGKSRRRLVLTTQLMQQVFPPLPPVTLELDAVSSYDRVIYWVCKMVLGDACGLLSLTASLSENKEATSQLTRNMTLDHFSKLLEDFDKRSTMLENEFLRLDESTSLEDLRLEWQELNGFSIVNRFGKFHGGKISDGTKISTFANPFCGTSEISVTALSFPVELPDRTLCMQL